MVTKFLLAATLGMLVTGTATDAQVAGTSTLTSSQGNMKVVALGYRATKLLHSAVYNIDGTHIGQVNDIVIAPDSFVSYIVVGVGGFLNIGQKDVAVPARLFRIVGSKVVLPGATKKELEALPAFHFSHL